MIGRATSIAVLFVFTSWQYARAQTSALSKSDCGSPPGQFAESETADTTIGGGFSGIFRQGAANGDYKKAVTKTRQEVYSRYPHADELDRRQYADYVTCVLIVTDPGLNGEGRRNAWFAYQKMKDAPVEGNMSGLGAPTKPQSRPSSSEVNCSPSPSPIPLGNNNTYVSGNGHLKLELDLPAATGSGDEHTVNKADSSECVIAVKPHGTDTIGGKNEAYKIVVAQESITFADRAPGKWALK